jgi:cell division septal protein FtsQ
MQKYIKYVGKTQNSEGNKKRFRLNFLGLQNICLLILFLLTFLVLPYHIKNFQDQFIINIKTNINSENFRDSFDGKYVWNVDIHNIKKQILQRNHLRNVQVKITLPNILYIYGEERKPFAIWWDYKKFFLIDDEGVILDKSVSDNDKKKYILVVGDEAIKNIHHIINVLTQSKQNGKVASIRFIGQRRWDLVLNNGIILKLPEKNELEAIRLFEKLVEKYALIKDNSVVDMRLAPEKVFIKNNIK